VRADFYLVAAARLRPLAVLDASLYTHLYYSALPVHPTARKLVLPMDPDGAALLASFSPVLKHKNRNLRTLLFVGTTTADGGVADVTCSQPRRSSPWPASRAVLGRAPCRVAFPGVGSRDGQPRLPRR
jgi:chitinase